MVATFVATYRRSRRTWGGEREREKEKESRTNWNREKKRRRRLSTLRYN